MSGSTSTTSPGANDGGCLPGGSSASCTTCTVRLAIQEITFSGHNPVEKDTMGPFPSPEWVAGRADADQSPISYVRNERVALNAKFRVTTAASRGTESVEIKGTATFGSSSLEWTGSVSVSPGDSEVSASLTSNNPLPNAVGIFESSPITWQFNPCGQGWASAGTSRNTVYVTLAGPSGTPNYWTLLDISCRAAAGETTASGLIPKVFTPLRSRAINRKRDGHNLTYWNPQNACTATNTNLLLAAANGAGQCGSWAEFLIDMYKVHGITSADKILIVRTVAAHSGGTEGFLVKNWIFDHPPPSAASAYTHWVPSQSRPGVNLPGQRNTAPPPAFFNHFIVRVNGSFWDPSYGAGPFTDQSAWENAAIDGLFRRIPAGASPPPGTTRQTGFEKGLNTATNIVEFWDLTTSTKI